MAISEIPALQDQIREHKFANRLELAQMVAECSNAEERLAEARTIIRQIAMHRVFDRFTKEQEAQLLDVLWPIANPEETSKLPLLFGYGSKDNVSK